MEIDLSRSITKTYMTVRAPNFLDPKIWDVRVVCETKTDAAYLMEGSNARGEIVVTPEGSKPWPSVSTYWLAKRPPSGSDDRIVTFSGTVIRQFTPGSGKYEIKFVLNKGEYEYAELFEMKDFGIFIRLGGAEKTQEQTAAA